MFNLAEVWGCRPDGSNPRRHVPNYPEKGNTHYIADEELARICAYLERADVKALEHPLRTLAMSKRHRPRKPAMPLGSGAADEGDGKDYP